MKNQQYEVFKKHLSYDPETGVLTRLIGPKAGNVQSAKDNKGYIIAFVAGKSYRAHRLAWMMYYNEPAPQQIDHINGNPSDNRISNLRAATAAQNTQNRHKNPIKKSGLPKGVRAKRNRYVATIYVNNKLIYSKSQKTATAAALAYNDLAKQYHGEFAQLNKLSTEIQQ